MEILSCNSNQSAVEQRLQKSILLYRLILETILHSFSFIPQPCELKWKSSEPVYESKIDRSHLRLLDANVWPKDPVVVV